jgi:hypothetical protein
MDLSLGRPLTPLLLDVALDTLGIGDVRVGLEL